MSASASAHDAEGASPLSRAHAGEIRVLLVGRPNSGKSSLYNALTGGHARVGNFPGVTVDVLEASVPGVAGGPPLRVVDLPGVYSVERADDPHSDEGHARAFLERAEGEARASAAPVLVAQVADATQLALGLRLTAELVRRSTPLALVVTQRDVLEREGRTIDEAVLGRALGIPVIAVSALDREMPAKLRGFLTAAATAAATPSSSGAPRPTHAGGHALGGPGPGPGPVGGAGGPFDPERLAAAAVREREGASDDERARRQRTARIDAVLLHPVLGLAAFLGIMTALFAAVFLVADPVTSLIDAGNRALGARAIALLGDGLLGSLVTDGILGGAGTVLAFLPQIVILTLAMEVIDASGYLARGAFLVDRLLRAAGLGGRSFVPLLTAHACAVPAISATRAIRDPGQRLRTILVLPLMTCSARIPTYGLLIAAFFGGRSALWKGGLFVGLYFAGVLAGLVASLVLGRAVRRATRALPLVLEMPSYRWPRPRVVGRVALRTCGRFLKDVGSVILVASVVLWTLLTVPGPTQAVSTAPPGASARVERMHGSIAAYVGHAIEPVTKVAGFDWRIDVGLMGSFGARELMVSTLGVIFGIEDDAEQAGEGEGSLAARIRSARAPDGSPAYGTGTALALMAFFVIACQCMSTLAAIRRETRSLRWPVLVAVYTYAFAFALATLVYRLS